MKSYLSLIPISAKVHKRQHRMTQLCIIFAVFLVTAVFSMADMGIRMEKIRLLDKHGSQAFEVLSHSTAQTLYVIAMILFVLILVTGVLMISGSIHSNVAQRIKFFGMMRCIGMSRRQIMNFVRLEALNWCKVAIPIGIILGVLVTWGLCIALRFGVGEEFVKIPLFEVSPLGICSGIVLGVVTVLIAAHSPAKRAAKVSPIEAVTGNAEKTQPTIYVAKTSFLKIETSLGIHHAVAKKRNLILMTSSFALSIILFLSFSVLIEFVGYVMPQFSNSADINISSNDGLNSIDSTLINELSTMNGVKRVFGRRSILDISAALNDQKNNKIDIISYDTFDLDCLVKDKLLTKDSDISKVYGNSNHVLAIGGEDIFLQIGDKINIGDEELEIAGLLKYNPFNSEGKTDRKITLITSNQTFTRLTGITGYSLIMVQTTKDVTNGDILEMSKILDENYTFHDKREQRTTNTYRAFQIFIYGFLTVIALVTVLNIMNSISMSVSAKIRQYGFMCAVGMDKRQIIKMIVVEAVTYALIGCIAGCVIGLLLSKILYQILISTHFSYAIWKIPLMPLVIILLIVFISIVVAVYAPAQRIHNLSVGQMINE